MYRGVQSALVAALVAALVGCGGGGGTDSASAPAPELQLTVEIAGVAATPDVSGKYIVRPGQSVVVRPSESAAWAGGNMGTGVTRTDVDTSTSRWVSRFDNPGALMAGAYQLTATASDGRTKGVDFTVQTGDYRNGDYTVFAANGTRQTLSIDYDAGTYTMTDGVGITATGTLTAPVAPAQDWTFQSSRIGGANTSTLRDLRDSIAGAFPFSVPFAGAGTYAPYPFVATRAFVLTQSRLDGAYDRAGIEHAVGGSNSTITQIGISAGGTVLKLCNDNGIYRIQNCPPASVVTNTVEADPAVPGMWLLKDPGTGVVQGRFAVAMVDGEKVYLSAGLSPSGASQLLRIGVPAGTPATTFTSAGWSTDGTLDATNATSTNYDMTMAAAGVGTLNLTRLGGTGSPGILVYSDPLPVPAQTYFTMRSQRLELLIGARNSVQAGFLHVGIVD